MRNVLANRFARVFFKDREGRFLLVSAGLAADLAPGRPPEELIGKTDFDLFTAAHARASFEDEQRVISTGEPIVGAIERETFPDRPDVVVSTTKLPLRDERGEIFGVWGMSRDITKQYAIESERLRLASIVEAANDAIISTDLEGVITSWNAGATALFGYSAEEMIGVDVRSMIPEGVPEGPVALADRALAGQRMGRVDTRRLHKDGRMIDVAATVFPLWDGEGQLAGTAGIIRDMTESKLNEEALRSSRSFMMAVADSMEGMFALDGDGCLTYMNKAAERMLGWSEEELRGRLMHEATHSVRKDGSAYPIEECPLMTVRTTGQPVQVDDDAFLTRSGQLLPVSYSSSPLVTGGVAGAVVVFRDITQEESERLRAARELETLAWVGRIRDALTEDRFVLYAQPIIELRTGLVTQHELLIRMLDAHGELIPPNAFLPTAERFGLIEEIDQWVIDQAARLVGEGHSVALQFNLSGRSMAHADLAATIRAALAKYGGAPDRLVCEITETALLEQTEAGERFVAELNAFGCRVALDDFGTGYAGFTYLKRLPVTYLKIDMEFVRDLSENPASQHVVKAIVSLAQAFGQKTIAEGAEDQRTLELLKELDVDYAQGYAVARPAPVSEVLNPAGRNSSRRRDGSP